MHSEPASPGEPTSDKRPRRDFGTYEKLLEAGRQAFSERGWALTTVDDVVKTAGVSRGSFYVYFQNKRQLFETLILDILNDLFERAAARRPGDTIFARLEAGNRVFLEVWERETGLMRTVMEALDDPGIEKLHTQMRQKFIDRTIRALTRHKESGITYDIDPRLAGTALAGMVDHFGYRHFVFGEPPGTEITLASMSYTLTALWYRSIYNEHAPPVPEEQEYLQSQGLI